jgi:hypothetical protein
VTGCTEADFQRLMPVAFPGVTYDTATRRYVAADGGWSLALGTPGFRAIAAIRVPMMPAVFRFETGDAETVLARFFRYFQKGGG